MSPKPSGEKLGPLRGRGEVAQFLAHCDFCPRTFTPLAWNSRTCLACRVAGAPDQSVDKDYDARLARYLRERGKKRKVA